VPLVRPPIPVESHPAHWGPGFIGQGLACGPDLKKFPNIAKITLLIRAIDYLSQRRFEKIVEESPTLIGCRKFTARTWPRFSAKKLKSSKATGSQPDRDLATQRKHASQRSLDVIRQQSRP